MIFRFESIRKNAVTLFYTTTFFAMIVDLRDGKTLSKKNVETGISPVANIFTLALDERAPHGFAEDVHPIRARALVRTKRICKALSKVLCRSA